MITFALSGLWHGAHWNFLLWGVLMVFTWSVRSGTTPVRNACVSFFGLSRRPVLHERLQILMTFGLITFSWIFFRANTFQDAIYIIGHLFSGWVYSSAT